MLDNIKLSYFIKVIFSYIFEGRKLKLIRYNKKMQNKINISLINYKIYNGTYFIYEGNGKGKECDGYSDKLIYEGDYLNGERKGRGKEYSSYSGKLFFEGEYLNGKRNGK